MIEERKKSLHQVSAVLCEIYDLLVETGEVAFPLYDEHIEKLDSIVKTVQAQYFGFVRFPTYEDKAAAYFCLIIKNHPVTDGNKRLAVMFLELYCVSFDLTIRLPNDVTLDEVAVSVEKSIDEPDLIPLTKSILFG